MLVDVLETSAADSVFFHSHVAVEAPLLSRCDDLCCSFRLCSLVALPFIHVKLIPDDGVRGPSVNMVGRNDEDRRMRGCAVCGLANLRLRPLSLPLPTSVCHQRSELTKKPFRHFATGANNLGPYW